MPTGLEVTALANVFVFTDVIFLVLRHVDVPRKSFVKLTGENLGLRGKSLNPTSFTTFMALSIGY